MSQSSNILAGHNSADVERKLSSCRTHFDKMLMNITQAKPQSADEIERSIFKDLMALGLELLALFFSLQRSGDYGETADTNHGQAKRLRVSERSYFSIFGKLRFARYLYQVGDSHVALLDRFLGLPERCYSYFLSEWVNHLNVGRAYQETTQFLSKFLTLRLSVAAAETISLESAVSYEAFYAELKPVLPATPAKTEDVKTIPAKTADAKRVLPATPAKTEDVKTAPAKTEDVKPVLPATPEKTEKTTLREGLTLTVVGFDGKGVPMIKAEAAKIRGRLNKGEKRQKKKEALVGVAYTIASQPRSAEEVAGNLIYPEQPKPTDEPASAPRSSATRYIASLKKSKRAVMREIYEQVTRQVFTAQCPLLCLIDGADALARALKDVFGTIAHRVTILDIIHVLEYIWLAANATIDGDQAAKKVYVHDKLKLILQGKVADYITELEGILASKNGGAADTLGKTITYFKNHKACMKYDEYLRKGYPIATGVVESACGHVVKNRMEIAGARWGIAGAEAILKLRSVVKSQDWEAYWTFYRMQNRYEMAEYPAPNSMQTKQLMFA